MRRKGLICGFLFGVVACGDSSPGGGGSGDEGSSGTTGTPEVTSTQGQDGPIPDGTGGSESSTSAPSTTSDGTTGGTEESGSSTGEGGTIFEQCFEDQFVNEPTILPNYDQFAPVIGTHCLGTNHQDIAGVERVVFLGDSITVGSPPTVPGQVYRSRLGDMLRDEFGLSYGNGLDESSWKTYNRFSGETFLRTAGDFSSCARWGGRNDDLPEGVGNQIEDCFPADTLDQVTLVVVTSGGNDLSAFAQDATQGVPIEDIWTEAEQMVAYKREAVEWIVEPGRFPNGVFVVFANVYEFTDGTADVMSCDVSGLAGFEQPVPNPEEITDLVVWISEQYMQIAVDTQTDMLFLLETFCGHGFGNDDPRSPCYRGPDTPRWFDLTCIHPNPTGHEAIADNFMSIISE